MEKNWIKKYQPAKIFPSDLVVIIKKSTRLNIFHYPIMLSGSNCEKITTR